MIALTWPQSSGCIMQENEEMLRDQPETRSCDPQSVFIAPLTNWLRKPIYYMPSESQNVKLG